VKEHKYVKNLKHGGRNREGKKTNKIEEVQDNENQISRK
jgi:hypothetical protein